MQPYPWHPYHDADAAGVVVAADADVAVTASAPVVSAAALTTGRREGSMTASVAEEQWDAVRESVRTTAGRFCELVSSIPDPGTRVTAKWSVADTTAHVTTIAFLNTMLQQAATVPFQMPGLTEAIAATTVEGVHGLNDQVLSYFTERDAGRLTGMLNDHVGLMLTAARRHDPAETSVVAFAACILVVRDRHAHHRRNAAAGPAPVHQGRRRQPVRPEQRPRGNALPRRRQAGTPGGDPGPDHPLPSGRLRPVRQARHLGGRV